jgi:uncharacterized iron-regulated protein
VLAGSSLLSPIAFAALVLAPLLAGCAGAAPPPPPAPPAAAIVDGEGHPIALDEVVRRAVVADVVLLGEVHGHPAGLALAAHLFERIAASGRPAALSLEFMERDEQAALDAYVAGTIDADELARRRRENASFPAGHRAMVDAARARGLPVIAANAPRRHVRKARLEGWDALRALPAAERALFVVPEVMPHQGYAARFAEAMGADPHGAGADERITAFYRAQLVWDATMADSIVRAIDAQRAPVVHVVGRFHVEHDGGLAQLVRLARPAARMFTLVVAEAPSDDDRGRADAIAYVGPAPATHP